VTIEPKPDQFPPAKSALVVCVNCVNADALNVAVTAWSVAMPSEQALPVQSPLNPANVAVPVGLAVSVTLASARSVCVQIPLLQLMSGAPECTTPGPTTVTARSCVASNAALTLASLESVTEQELVAEVQPVHESNTACAPGAAVRTTVVPARSVCVHGPVLQAISGEESVCTVPLPDTFRVSTRVE
jgi:hypothetical protein